MLLFSNPILWDYLINLPVLKLIFTELSGRERKWINFDVTKKDGPGVFRRFVLSSYQIDIVFFFLDNHNVFKTFISIGRISDP